MRLARIVLDVEHGEPSDVDLVAELLTAHDHWAAEAARWKTAAKLLQRTHETTMEALSDLADPDDDSRDARALRRIIETAAPEGERL
jgi:hypothetical protein